jgi:cytidine deaminase
MTSNDRRPIDAAEQAHLRAAQRHARRAPGPPRERTGAIAVTADGQSFAGIAVRLETATGLSVCAEQVALCAARAGTEAPVVALLLWVPGAAGRHPCGQCLQIWHELAPEAGLVLQRGDETPQRFELAELMPDAFVDFRPPEQQP